ncbi:ABC transporter permease [Paraferrimonas sedimenticola]|uniref:ABC transporter permease n=1 Tax=Paraferrimonas sedimenticola TaxID=375674 RepID=A0AA37W077_9GAMM|nr:ABC transporter permease [Paraferrimonas sedimenticola]GLP96040.1 ABC transporter permease [Paraferrimonas sedimenticola]
MIKQILLRRFWQLITVVWGVGTLTFVLLRSLPGDMAYRIAAGRFGYDNVTAGAADMVRAELELDLPVWQQYFNWLWDLLSFNLGTSMVSGGPVIAEVQHQLGHSVLLAFVGVTISLLIAIPLGLAAARYGGWLDRISLVVSTGIRAMPVFLIGLVFVLIFALELNWFPVAGFGEAKFLVLPAISLAVVLAATSNRVIRDAALAVFRAPYYQFSQVKGLSRWQTFVRHGIRNMSVPVVAFMGIQLITVIEGIVMIESLFSWPGIGHGLAHAIFSRDIPVIQGAALCMGVMFVMLNTLVDIACAKLDPRQEVKS